NMNIQQIGESAVVFVEEMFVKNGASNDLSPVKREIFDQGVLACREGDRFPGARNVPGSRIDRDFPDFDSRAALICRATDQSADTRESLRQIERLHQIIISASVEATDSVARLVTGGKHQHRRFFRSA